MKIGDKVYFQEHWSQSYLRGTIIEITDNGIRCNNCDFVSPEGVKTGRFVGETGAFAGQYFSTIRELLDYVERRNHAKVLEFKESIKNLNDLLAFPLKHCFCGEEYTDDDAVKAYKERAFELTGISIEEKEIYDHDKEERE